MPEKPEKTQRQNQRRQPATRIEDDSFTFNRIVPLALGALVIITVLLGIASVLVLLGL